ncbi:MAG: transcriptional repressor [Acidobacteria bacterium]|nr:transcriptional repressor [Acidobacteriota bacterium]
MNNRQVLNTESIVECLREHGIQPSAQRVAVADFVLQTEEHPSAERVLSEVQQSFPMISRATVYNTLHLFVERGLLREVKLSTSSIVYDANTDRHHHLIDEATGEIHDIPWETVTVDRVHEIEGFEVHEYQVVFKGRRETTH